MQIDFHHGVTYVLARLAGLDHESAAIVAYSAQYVDDATHSGVIRFENGALFSRMSSAHKLLDYRNFQALANHYVWIPFHFLPGNGGLPVGQEPAGGFIEKVICRPDSPVAQDMVRECIVRKNAPYGLQRLGITMHVYADTWAHQGFAGIRDDVNAARHIFDAAGNPDDSLMKRLANYFIREALPLGHGAVLGNPDRPYLKWGYVNGRGERIVRDNPTDFLTAADRLCQAMQRYVKGNPDAKVPGLPAKDRALIDQMLRSLTDRDGEVRHQAWLKAIAEGQFSFGPVQVEYIPTGKGSWKFLALGSEHEVDDDDRQFGYDPQFLTSSWKLFHDALRSHHVFIIHDLLPRYGICAA